MAYLHLLLDKATRDANRNRYLVVEVVLGEWAVVRVGHKGGLLHVVSTKSEAKAHGLADQLNDLFEDGMIY
jgi:hypothetical protein